MSRPIHFRLSGRLSAGLALGATAIATAFAAGPSQATTTGVPVPGADAPTAVQPGISAAALPGAVPFGTTPPSTPETVSFVLREQNLPQLERAVEHGVRDYLSVSEFARGYGQSPDSIGQLTSYLAAYGISTQVYPDDVDVVATGTAAEFDAALSVQQKQYHVPEQHGKDGTAAIPAQNVHGTAQSPLLPFHIARSVLSVLGLTNYGPFGSQAVHVDASIVAPQAGSTNGCLALTGLPGACHLPSDYASTYGLSALYAKGATGAGRTEAIVTLAALDPGAPQYFWQNVAHTPASSRTVNVINVDGGPGAPSYASNSAETDLDTEQAGALAPGANVIVYQAPNSDSGFADAFFYAASQNTADAVSTSWLESETYLQALIAAGAESASYEPAFDEAFLEMAAQGQSGFAPAGDQAAYAASADLGTTNLSVDASGDSPYITAAGGTTLPWSGQLSGPGGTATVTVPAQRTWGWDYLWGAISTVAGIPLPAAAGGNIGGTGGGFSAIEPSPAYQQDVPGTHTYHAVEYLIPENEQLVGKTSLTEPNQWNFSAAPTVTEDPASGRAVPDVSADADPYSGYLIYAPAFGDVGHPLLEGGWGGTSFVAPQFSGSTAVIDSLLRHRVGFWNPAIYAFATGPGSPFTPIEQAGTGSDNLYYTGNPGQPYNPGSGLGYPDFGKLAADYASGSRG
jgi:subtilase family serine protease